MWRMTRQTQELLARFTPTYRHRGCQGRHKRGSLGDSGSGGGVGLGRRVPHHTPRWVVHNLEQAPRLVAWIIERLELGPRKYCSTRLRMPCNSTNNTSKLVG
jgi:hypothetical protein